MTAEITLGSRRFLIDAEGQAPIDDEFTNPPADEAPATELVTINDPCRYNDGVHVWGHYSHPWGSSGDRCTWCLQMRATAWRPVSMPEQMLADLDARNDAE